MTTSLFPFVLVPALTNPGLIAPAAKMAFYLTNTTTLASVYDSDGDPISQAANGAGVVGVTADAFGRFPSIYLDDAITYRVRLRTSLGVQLGDDLDPVVPTGAFAATLAAPGGSSEIGYNAGITNSVDRTVQARLQERLSILDFYEDTDTDYSAAVNKFIAYANANGGYKTLAVPGRYALGASTLTTITADHVYIVGESRACGFVLSANAPTFNWKGCFGGGLQEMVISHSGTPGASAAVVLLEGTGSPKFTNITLQSTGRFLTVGSAGNFCSGTFVYGLDGYVYNGGQSTFELVEGAGLFVKGQLSVAGIPTPAADRTSTMVQVPGTTFINLATGCSWDTVQVDVFAERFWRMISAVTADGKNFLNCWTSPLTNCDYFRDDVYHFEALGPTGGIFGMRINGYGNSWEGMTFNVMGPGVNRDSYVALESLTSGLDGMSFTGVNTTDWRVLAPSLASADRLNTGKTALRIAASGISVDGGLYGQFTPGGGFPWQPDHGITIAADLDKISVQNVRSTGVIDGWDIATNAAGFPNRLIANNLNATYAGLRVSGAYAMPASGATWTNTTGHRIFFFFSGLTDISLNGGGLTQTAGCLQLDPADFFVATYGGTPVHYFKVST